MSLRILFVPLMERGHIQSWVGVMQRLQLAGHEIACFGTRRLKVEEQFSAAGIHCQWFPRDPENEAETASLKKTSYLKDAKRLALWCSLSISRGMRPESIENLQRPSGISGPMSYR